MGIPFGWLTDNVNQSTKVCVISLLVNNASPLTLLLNIVKLVARKSKNNLCFSFILSKEQILQNCSWTHRERAGTVGKELNICWGLYYCPLPESIFHSLQFRKNLGIIMILIHKTYFHYFLILRARYTVNNWRQWTTGKINTQRIFNSFKVI